MENSRTPLRLWFQAIYLHAQAYSINALQLSQIIVVTYKTAWLICHKIRHAMSQAESSTLLSGIVRISEAVYCKQFLTYDDWHKREQPLLVGSSENQGGEISHIKMIKQPKNPMICHIHVLPDVKQFLKEQVTPDAAPHAIVTSRFGKKANRSLMWKGFEVTQWLAWIFRGIGPKHLQVYLDQFCYLQNRKHLENSLFPQLLIECALTSTLIYPDLIGSSSRGRSINRTRLTARDSKRAC